MAELTIPGVELSTDCVEFGEVKCGECQIISIQLYNAQPVPCHWDATDYSAAARNKRKATNDQFFVVASWPAGQPPLNFGQSNNCRKSFSSENCCPKMQNLELRTCIFGKFRGKVGILNIYNFLCQKFAIVCRNSVGNIQLAYLANFLKPRPRWFFVCSRIVICEGEFICIAFNSMHSRNYADSRPMPKSEA